MFENVDLTELDDAQLDTVLDELGAGKKPVYKRPIRELLDAVGDKQGSLSVAWKELNPNADKRATVIQGFKSALKKHDQGYRIRITANPVDDLVTLYVSRPKSA
jgi:hypothetical protein